MLTYPNKKRFDGSSDDENIESTWTGSSRRMILTLARLVPLFIAFFFFFEDKFVNKTLAPISAAAEVVDVNGYVHVAPHRDSRQLVAG